MTTVVDLVEARPCTDCGRALLPDPSGFSHEAGCAFDLPGMWPRPRIAVTAPRPRAALNRC
jgi:hypothetical protein